MSGACSRYVRILIPRKAGILIFAELALLAGGAALSEQLTITTSYPAPSGIYNQLVTTGNSGTLPAGTTFNRNAGNTILVPNATNAGGLVGIGTSSPASKLQVAGGVQLGDDTAACTAAKAGTQRWHAGALELCDGTNWVATKSRWRQPPLPAGRQSIQHHHGPIDQRPSFDLLFDRRLRRLWLRELRVARVQSD